MRERSTVVGVFEKRADAERAIDELHRIGFRDDQIGFIWRGEDRTHTTTSHEDTAGDHAASGAVGGMVAGAGIGGLIAAAAALAIPGFGPVVAGGILATILGGAAAGAAAGGILGALVGMGVPEEEARYYEHEVGEGRFLVTVKADSRYDEARDVLYRFGAYDVEHRRGAVGAGAVGGMDTGHYAGTPVGTTNVAAGMDATRSTGFTSTGDWATLAPEWRQRWQTRYGTSGGRWEEYEPGYRFGYEMANDARFRDRDFSAVEPELRREFPSWSERSGYRNDSAWDRFRDSVREAWDEARGTRRAA
jgi:hypothetical protein